MTPASEDPRRQLMGQHLFAGSSRDHAGAVRPLLLQSQQQLGILGHREVIGRAARAAVHHQPGLGRVDPQQTGSVSAHGRQQSIGKSQIGWLGLHHRQLLCLQEVADQIQVVLILGFFRAGTTLHQAVIIEKLGQLGGRGQPVGDAATPEQPGGTPGGEEGDGGIETFLPEPLLQQSPLPTGRLGARIQYHLIDPGAEFGQRRGIGRHQGRHMTVARGLEHGKAGPGQHEITDLVISYHQNTLHALSCEPCCPTCCRRPSGGYSCQRRCLSQASAL